MIPNFVIGVNRKFYARACDMDVNAVDMEVNAVEKADVTSITEQQFFFGMYPLQVRHTSVFVHTRPYRPPIVLTNNESL